MDLSAASQMLETLADRGGAYGAVHLEFEGALAVLTLDNPRAHNALSAQMMAQLARVVLRMQARTDVAALLVRSTDSPPQSFCAGGDLRDVRRSLTEPGQGERMARAMAVVLDALAALPVVSVAAIQGAALGGGAELLTAVDERFLASDACVGFVQASMGVAAGWGGTPRLVRQVGTNMALRWLVEARLRSVAELGDWVIEAPNDAEQDARQWLEQVLVHPTAALRAVKGQVVAAWQGAALGDQATLFAQVWGGQAHQAALSRSVKGRSC